MYCHRLVVTKQIAAAGSSLAGNVGRVEVKQLDWSRPEQRNIKGGPWDYILAAGGDRRMLLPL